MTEIYEEFHKKVMMAADFKKICPELKHPELVQVFTSGAATALCSYWYANREKISSGEFAELGTDLIVNGMKSFL